MVHSILNKTSESPEVKRAGKLITSQFTRNQLADTTNGIFCASCGSAVTLENILSEQNSKFIMDKCREGKLDEAITVARIVNEQLPQLSISGESKALAIALAESFANKMDRGISTLTTLTDMLSKLLEKLPEGLKQEFAAVLKKLETVNETTSKSSENVVQKFNETFSELMNKPTSKGKAGEKTLSQAWSLTYTEDDIEEKGGPGEADFVVCPSVKSERTGKLSVERKSGSQKYKYSHVKEAIKHARDEGARYALVVYDSFEANMPETYGPLYIDKVDGIIVAVTDVANNGWKMARYIFSVLELNINGIGQHKIDVTKIAETVKEMYKITEQIDQLRKKNNSAVQACESVRDIINTLEQIFQKYVHTLRLSLGEL
jgi:vacuolar-type H+-ATPase subunit D/Vma8